MRPHRPIAAACALLLACLAALLITAIYRRRISRQGERMSTGIDLIAAERQRQISVPPAIWPWPIDCWKPGDGTTAGRIRELAKAGALIAAEIDRLLRMQDSPAESSFLVEQELSLRQILFIKNPHPLAVSVTRSTPDECDVTIEGDSVSSSVTLRLLNDVEIAPGIRIRLNGLRKRITTWADLRISANRHMQIQIQQAEILVCSYQNADAGAA